jgi:multidrug resistance protein, MATE family
MGGAPRATGAAAAGGWLKLAAAFALSWPLILANVSISIMTATDFMMLGRLSPNALAAGALGFFLYQPPFLLGIGVVAALSPIVAAKVGAGLSGENLKRATHQALLSALLISAVAWIALSETAAILTAIGEPPDLARDAGVYMRGYQWGMAPSLLFFAGRSAFAALGRPRPTLVAGLVGAAFNAVANYALIFGKLGAPALGIIGSGLATTLSQALMFAILIAASLIDPRMRRLGLFALPWSPAGHELAALWRLGLPIGATIVAEAGVFSAATLVMGLIGKVALEAHTVAVQIASLAFMVPLGLGQAATVRVGRAFGARDSTAISHAGSAAFGLTAAFAVLSAATMIAAPRIIIAPFVDVAAPENAPAVDLAVTLLKIAAIFQIFDASQATLANMLRGLHDSRIPFVIALVGYWAIGAPVGIALGFAGRLGAVGVWIGLALGLAVVALLLAARWLRKEGRGFGV